MENHKDPLPFVFSDVNTEDYHNFVEPLLWFTKLNICENWTLTFSQSKGGQWYWYVMKHGKKNQEFFGETPREVLLKALYWAEIERHSNSGKE